MTPTSPIYVFISSQIQNVPHFTLITCLRLKTKLRHKSVLGTKQFFFLCKQKFDILSYRCVKSTTITDQRQETKATSKLLGSAHSSKKSTFIVRHTNDWPAAGNGKGVACPIHVSFHLTLKPLSHSLTCSQAPTVILHLNQAVCKSWTVY